MTMPSILGHGVLLLGALLAAFARPRSHRAAATPQTRSSSASPAKESRERIPIERLPDSSTLAGVPLRILLSDRAGPGGLLKDTLMTRPSSRDA